LAGGGFALDRVGVDPCQPSLLCKPNWHKFSDFGSKERLRQPEDATFVPHHIAANPVGTIVDD
jgi:hypothetical protein